MDGRRGAAVRGPGQGDGPAVEVTPAAQPRGMSYGTASTTEFGPGEMPAEFAAAVTLQELALHGWDLARATGAEYRLSEPTSAAVLAVVEQLAEQTRATGGYGPAVTVPTTVGTFERALAVSGRNPGWEA